MEHPTAKAVELFTQDFKTYKTGLEQKMHDVTHRLSILETQAIQRPARSNTGIQTHEQKAMQTYIRTGREDSTLEFKAMSGVTDANGGYLLDPVTSQSIQSVMRGAGTLRAVANVVEVSASSYDVLVDYTDIGAAWATETGSLSDTSTPQVDRISVVLHDLSALPKISQRLLDDSAFDVEGWLSSRIADKFMRAEGDAFINGDGVDKPRGILNHTIVSDVAAIWGELGYIPTGASGALDSSDPADALIDLVYALEARYRANGTFVMNSKTSSVIRKLKDTDGRFLWAEGLASGQPARLMGYPVLVSEDMPDITTDSMSIAFGDFKAGYTVAERPEIRLMRDPFSAKPYVIFYASKRVGGDVTDFSAIKFLKFSVS